MLLHFFRNLPLPKHIRILADANNNVILKDNLINPWCFNPWHCFPYVSNCCYHSRWKSVIDILGKTSHIVKPPTKSVTTAISLTERKGRVFYKKCQLYIISKLVTLTAVVLFIKNFADMEKRTNKYLLLHKIKNFKVAKEIWIIIHIIRHNLEL